MCADDFFGAVASLEPSLSVEELTRYDRLQQSFSNKR